MAHFPTYEMQYKVFRWTGMAKNEFKSLTQRILYGIYDISLTLSYLIFQLAFAYQMTVIASEVSFETLLLNSVSFFMCLGVLVKRLFVLGKKDRVKELYVRIKKDFENPLIKDVEEADLIIYQFDQHYKTLNNVFYVTGLFTTLLYSAPAYGNFPNELPFPVPFQQDLGITHLKILVIWQTILVCVAFINYLAYDSLVWGFLMLITTRLRIVAKMWENFAENYPYIEYEKYIPEYCSYPRQSEYGHRNGQKYNNLKHDKMTAVKTTDFLKRNVVYYQEIVEEMEIVENVYSFPLLIHLVGGAILMGIMIVFVLIGGFKSWFGYRSFVFLFCGIADVYYFSYYGTKINEAKDILAAAVYACPWYEGDVPTAKLFLFTMSMMRNKLKFTAGGFIPINFESFLSLMKLSYNLLAVLK